MERVEYDCGLILGPDQYDCGRITIIEYQGTYEVVYHRNFGPLGGTDEPIGEFDDLEEAKAWAWKYSQDWNKKVYDERERNRQPLQIDWEEIERLRKLNSDPDAIGYGFKGDS